MPYEKTIGGDDLTYTVTLSSGLMTVYDMLQTADKTELLQYTFDNGSEISGNRIRTVVDGYIFSSSAMTTAHKTGGATETIAANTKFPLPVHRWHRKRLFAGTGSATVRIILSANYNVKPLP